MAKRIDARDWASRQPNYSLRDLESRPFHERELPYDFRSFVDGAVLPRISFVGYKLDQKRELARQMIYSLIKSGLSNGCVSDVRGTDKTGTRLRVNVWDAIEAAGFAKVCKGSEESGKVTRYQATNKLLQLQNEWTLQMLEDLNLVRNTELPHDPQSHALVYLHTGKLDPSTGKPLQDDERKKPVSFLDYIRKTAQPGSDGEPDPQAIENGLDYFREIEDIIERINSSNLDHAWKATHPESGRSFQPNICLRQIHAGEFFRAVRLYSWGELSGQNLSKAVRREILIDGERTAELDYSGMVTRMLYHYRGIDPEGDVYRPDEVFPKFHGFGNVSKTKRIIVRDFVKRATNICWNVRKRSAAHSSIGKLLAEHPKRKFLRNVIYATEDIESTNEIVDRLLEVHSELDEFFFTGQGIELMTTEGRIMLRILMAFADAAKPALGIHDAVVCRASDVEFAREAMTDAYHQFLQFDPVIDRAY